MLSHDLMEALAGVGALCLGVAGIAVFARDPQGADEHDLADHHEPDPELAELRARFITQFKHGRPVVLTPTRQNWPLLDVGTRPAPPADPTPVPWRPPYAELIHAQVVRRYGDSPADRAARMLREIAAEQRGLAVAR